MKTTVSIIVPVYNAQASIRRCVESLVDQTYTAAEIILVNDGSRDNSLDECEKLARKFSDVKLISQENQGVSVARNTGIEHASGEFISFVDSDDYVLPTYLENLIKAQQRSNADFVFGGITNRDYDTSGECRVSEKLPKPMDWSMQEFLKHFSEYEIFLNSPCKSLYRKELIISHNVRFPRDIDIGEDQIFVAEYLLYCARVCAIRVGDYQYVNLCKPSLSASTELEPPEYIFSSARSKTELMKKYGIDCGDTEYAKIFYNTMIFNFMRVYGWRLQFDKKTQLKYCKTITEDETTQKYVKKYAGHNIQTKVLRLLVCLKANHLLNLMWKIRCKR